MGPVERPAPNMPLPVLAQPPQQQAACEYKTGRNLDEDHRLRIIVLLLVETGVEAIG